MVQLLYKKHIKDILWFSNFGDSRTTEMPQRPGWMQRSKHWMYRALLIPNLCFSKIMSKLGKEQMEILKINIWWLFSRKTIPKYKLQKGFIPLR